MLEWLILVIVVPAVVVPVVLVAGFAGCDLVYGLTGRTEPKPPIITVSEGSGLDSIALAWTFAAGFQTFEVERLRLPEETCRNLRSRWPLPYGHRPRGGNELSVSRPRNQVEWRAYRLVDQRI